MLYTASNGSDPFGGGDMPRCEGGGGGEYSDTFFPVLKSCGQIIIMGSRAVADPRGGGRNRRAPP